MRRKASLLLARSLALLRLRNSFKGIQNTGLAGTKQVHRQTLSHVMTSERWPWMRPSSPWARAFSIVTLCREYSATTKLLENCMLQAEVATSEKGSEVSAEEPSALSVTCESQGCKRRYFGYAATGLRTHCKQHRVPGMVDLVTVCKHPGCQISASFNFVGVKGVTRCSKHAEEGMVQKGRAMCSFPGCWTLASYGYLGAKGATRCHKHAEKDMVPNTVRRCSYPGCEIIAQFVLPGSKGGVFCKNHREKGMVTMHVASLCCHPGCLRTAVYKRPGDAGGTVCSLHREAGMVRWDNALAANKCVVAGCEARALFVIVSVQGSVATATHCSVHFQKGMALLRNKCAVPNCLLSRAYGPPGGRPQWCHKHKLQGMVRPLNWRLCSESGCTRARNYGHPGGKAQWCTKHKEEGSVNLAKPPCSATGCKVPAEYGFPSDPKRRALTCNTHRGDGMVRVKRIPCAEKGCCKIAQFASPGEILPRFCVDHYKEGMVRLLATRRGDSMAATSSAAGG